MYKDKNESNPGLVWGNIISLARKGRHKPQKIICNTHPLSRSQMHYHKHFSQPTTTVGICEKIPTCAVWRQSSQAAPVDSHLWSASEGECDTWMNGGGCLLQKLNGRRWQDESFRSLHKWSPVDQSRPVFRSWKWFNWSKKKNCHIGMKPQGSTSLSRMPNGTTHSGICEVAQLLQQEHLPTFINKVLLLLFLLLLLLLHSFYLHLLIGKG